MVRDMAGSLTFGALGVPYTRWAPLSHHGRQWRVPRCVAMVTCKSRAELPPESALFNIGLGTAVCVPPDYFSPDLKDFVFVKCLSR